VSRVKRDRPAGLQLAIDTQVTSVFRFGGS
jgi:hypothetical protein